MKQTKILLALMMLAVFASCNDEFVDNTNSRHISITAELPDDNLTRASLSQKEGSLDFLTQWDEGDVVNLHIEQDGRFYEVKYTRPNALPGEVSFNKIPIKNISEDRKSCTLDFDLPEGVDADRPYKVYGSTFCRGVVGSDDDDNKVLVFLCSFYRANSMSIPLYCEVESNALSSGIEFKHFLAYEILHIKNNSKETISFTHKGFDVDKAWYHLGCGIYIWPTYHYIETKYYTNKDSGERIEINAGETKDILSCYYPTGEKIENARLKAIINGNEVLSSDTKSSDLDIEPAKAYHMYAIWDGDELKFGKEDIRETIIYPTSSYQLSEDGKTLVKWLGEETEIDMSADPAFDNVTAIGTDAFRYPKSLTLSKSVETIHHHAFRNCYYLEHLHIPPSVKVFEFEAFPNGVKNVYIEDLTAWCKASFDNMTFAWGANPLDFGANLYVNNELVKDLVLPEGLSTTGAYAFSGWKGRSVTFPKSFKQVSHCSFMGCEIESINFSLSEEPISIGTYAFSYCENIETLNLIGVKYVGGSAFNRCKRLSTINIGAKLQYIETSSFLDCPIKAYNVIEYNPSYSSDNGILLNADGTVLMRWPNGKDQSSYIIPASIKVIGESAFGQATKLSSITINENVQDIKSYAFRESGIVKIDIPNSVKTIGSGAFYGCRNLNSIILPEGLEKIEDGLISNCTSLVAFTIPSKVKYIGDFTFQDSENLCTITSLPKNPPQLGGCAFYAFHVDKVTLYVPSESVDAYKNAEGWNDFGAILPLEGDIPQ